jgi:hypothetical protein
VDSVTIESGETFESVVDDYCHFKTPCDEGCRGRCRIPGKFRGHATQRLWDGLSVNASIESIYWMNSYKVRISLNPTKEETVSMELGQT